MLKKLRHGKLTFYDQARLDILQDLNPESALLVLDWAMKFLPRKFREAQSDWFGKRGISWHITVAIRKTEDDKMQMLTFVHVFEKCTQESDTVLAIVDDVFSQLKSVAPEIKTVFLRQDNAGCYHSTSMLLSVQQLATKNNIHLSCIDYSDPQGGKGSCDRKAATIKSHIKVYLNEGHDVETPDGSSDRVITWYTWGKGDVMWAANYSVTFSSDMGGDQFSQQHGAQRRRNTSLESLWDRSRKILVVERFRCSRESPIAYHSHCW